MIPSAITVLSFVAGELIPEHGVVLHGIHRTVAWAHWRSVDGTYRSTIDFENEGVTWIRGHHVRQSPELAALFVAYTLRAA